MKFFARLALASFLLGASSLRTRADVTDPHVTSWLTANAGQYARVYQTASARTAGTSVTTWPSSGLVTNPAGGVSTPAYSDVQRVAYSANYVYIYTTGLASYVMGNWLTPNGTVYTSWPSNRAAIHRIPRNPTIPTTKQANHGSGGVLVNGVFVWENGDAQSYANASSTSSTASISMSGDGIWNRLAGVAETFNFDSANGHQPSSGAYHNHINPKALRYQLGDNVTYDASAKTYSEAGTPTKHSPIIGWANDGLPIYGPYGYSSAMDATSGIRRMVSGFVKRDGTNGTDNLATTGRVKLPVWAASVQGRSQTLSSSQYGPSTTATYALGPVNKTCSIGTFAEDYEYLGDLGKTQGVDFDLNRQNVRFCVTPEYPSGTYAYFVCIDSSGNTVFPDVINQEYFGSAPNGQGTVTSISETVTEYVDAGPAAAIAITATASGSNVALAWNSAEGATYKVESSPDNATWTTLSSAVTSGGLTTNYTASTNTNYYRVTLTAIASYDTGGTYGTPVGKTGTALFGTAIVAPSITTQPAGASVTVGTSVTFTVAASGTGTLSYQWKKDGAAISGATSASFTIASPQLADAGSYTVVVSNSAGSATSNAATLTVNAASSAPSITTQPVGATVNSGASVTFSVVASGTGTLSYQWKKDGAAISGATNASYTIASAQATDAGSYTVTISSIAGSVTSGSATLTVNVVGTPPTITTQPVNATVNAGTSVTFTVVASGTGTLSYQWKKSGTPIAGATSASFTIASPQSADAGSYTVTVTNSGGSATSSAATLTVNTAATAPTITVQPANVSVLAGGSATFTVVASGTAPLSYQWTKSGVAIVGATGASYAIAGAQSGDAGTYAVTVTNSAGAATSNAATLTVTSRPAIVTQPTNIVAVTGGNATFSVVASGGALAYQWYKDGIAISGATAASYTITGVQPANAGSYICVVTNSAGSIVSSIASLSVSATGTTPAITSQPASTAASAGGNVTLSVGASTGGITASYQWRRNGTDLSGATGATLALANLQPSDTGLYDAVVASGGTATTSPAIVGLTTTQKVVGAGEEVQHDVFVAANGNTFDQVLVEGAAATVTADYTLNQITRTSFIDLNDDIVQVEFSGPGTLSLVLDNASGPALPVNYNQSVTYWKGHAGIVITGATEDTNVSVFSVGRITAVNPALFRDDVAYNGIADLAFIAIASSNGKFGGVRAADANFFATKGLTGLYAPGVQFVGPVYLGDISAFDAATPVLMLGSATNNTWITGGDFLQANGRPVQVSGLTQLKFTNGTDSHGNALSAKTNQAVLQQNGTDVTAQIVLNPSP
ncbi:MAG TPA: immunoglobulin domain-containing protein [Opitutaceae bacterium]|nr:immunoglobulin domain-containing protein [Opitutaceae bacterium]